MLMIISEIKFIIQFVKLILSPVKFIIQTM